MRRVVPGSSENSFLYHRITGSEYGLQMPPTGPLRAEQIALVKRWIDEGAPRPDSLANEADLPRLNPKAVALVEALRTGDRQSFLKAVNEDPKLLNARGPEGSSPFMYAVLYSDAAMIEQLLKKGADPNRRNDAKATPLMWAATDLEKTRVLLARGAEVNAMSDDMRTPLMIAAAKPGAAPIVKMLLEKGANPNPTKNPMSESSPLIQATYSADPEIMRLILARGADVQASGAMALVIAITIDCKACTDLLLKQDLLKFAYTFTLSQITYFADIATVRLMLDRGAEINAADPYGRTALMYAAISDLMPVEVVKLLIERGADINAKSPHKNSRDTGMTVLDIAPMNGETPIVDLLLKAGAKSAVSSSAAPAPQRAATVQSAIQRSIPLLQRTDAGASAKAGCVSCHNNNLEAMAISAARKSGFQIDEGIAAQAGAEAFGDEFGPTVLGYILVGLHGEGQKPNLDTDAVAMYLKNRQLPDGHWPTTAADTRQPLCLDYIGQTVLAMRGLQLYTRKADKAAYERSIDLAARWIARTEPRLNEDRVWRLLGLAWAGKDNAAMSQAIADLRRMQRSDGGWSDLPTLESSVYVTARAVVALQTAGITSADQSVKRGLEFLLINQMEDGSWFVRTRALALQPFFDSGFPHGVNQAISAAGTSWATLALSMASRASGNSATAGF
jgi:ankyrin repeat protein